MKAVTGRHPASERIALIWDLGAGNAHAVKLERLAQALQARGHRPLLLARNLRAVHGTACALSLPLLQAPHNDWFPDRHAPASHADIWWNEVGLHDAVQTAALFAAWLHLLETLDCSRVIAEGAPLAIAAARKLGLPTAAYGTGFMLPPGPPWPRFRDWEAVDDARLAERETQMSEHLAAVGTRPEHLRAEREALLTWPAFDHFPQRQGGDYFGPLGASGAQRPRWLGRRPRVFAYLHGHYPQLAPVLEALGALGADTLLVISGKGCNAMPDGVRRADGMLDLDETLRGCDLVVSHAGNLVISAAAAGKPLLVLPLQAEQFITARRVCALGIGLSITAGIDAPDYALAIERLLTDPAFATAARNFAQALPQWDRAQQLHAILDHLLAPAVHAPPQVP